MEDKPYKEHPQGLTIVYTGDGKGKTTAALGLCVRAVGHGNKVAIIQFLKSDWPYGERIGLQRLAPEVTIQILGVGCIGFPGDNTPIEEHRRAAIKTLNVARQTITQGLYDIVILDEINVAVELELITIGDVMDLLDKRPAPMSLVLTGRDAHQQLIERADLVTEMKEIKHPFKEGYLGKKGIDF